MALDPGTEVWRNKDGRKWRIGHDAEIAWIQQNTGGGRAITSAIPPVFEAYGTLELPGTGDHDAASWFEDPDRHDAGVLAVLTEHTTTQSGWLGYLETGIGAETSFYEVPKVTLYADWHYVIIKAGPEQAGTWRAYDVWKGVLPDLMFPAARSWPRLDPVGRRLDVHRRIETAHRRLPGPPGSAAPRPSGGSSGQGRDSARAPCELTKQCPFVARAALSARLLLSARSGSNSGSERCLCLWKGGLRRQGGDRPARLSENVMGGGRRRPARRFVSRAAAG